MKERDKGRDRVKARARAKGKDRARVRVRVKGKERVRAKGRAKVRAKVKVKGRAKVRVKEWLPAWATAAADRKAQRTPNNPVGTPRGLVPFSATPQAGSPTGDSKEDSEAAEKKFQDEAWFAKLPPEVRAAIRSNSQRRPPRGYDERDAALLRKPGVTSGFNWLRNLKGYTVF